MMENPEKVGDYVSSLVMIAVAVGLIALVIAGTAWLFVRVWPW